MLRQNMSIRIGGPLTPVVKKLIIINAAVFMIQQLVGLLRPGEMPGIMENMFGLHHLGFVNELKLWQILTYMFLHGGWVHILFNLLSLWMFAGELEQEWGGSLFLRYYLYNGLCAGIFIAIMNYFLYVKYSIDPVTVGASGAIYALLLAYAWKWPNRQVLLYFVVPLKVKYFVLLFGGIAFYGTLLTTRGVGGNISHIGHLGGLVSGLIFLVVRMRKTDMAYTKDKFNKGSIIARFMKKKRLAKKKKEIESRIEAKRIIDESLEKIARHGMSSLSKNEKIKLEWARKHYYPDTDETLH